MVPGFDARIKHELTMINRIGTNIKIVNEYNPDDMDKFAGRPIQPWLGAAKLAKLWQLGDQDWKMSNFTISKAEYDECGAHYLRESFLSNILLK